MSDEQIDESAGLGAADPITGVTGARDDLDDDAQLPDDEDESDPDAVRAESADTVTNDAVAGETVDPGRGDGNDGPTGGAPAEQAPEEPENDLDPAIGAEPIDLDDEE